MFAQALRNSRRLLPAVGICKLTLSESHNRVLTPFRCLSITPSLNRILQTKDAPDGRPPPRKNFKESILPDGWQSLVEKYPEFLPDPLNNSPIAVHREIDAMLARRKVIEIPEFYVGSILAVTASDKNSETKRSRFVGICINRTGQLSRANFTLRNVIDGMGCEILYDMYNPLILSIEVLRLEKRLDDTLIYLRDALDEYSTIPEDMKPEVLEEGAEVPINKTIVKMKPQPWTKKWERHQFQGIETLHDIPIYFADKIKKYITDNPVYSYDLMREYRLHCTEEMIYTIMKRLVDHEKNVVLPRKESKQRRFLRVNKRVNITPTS